MAIKSDWGVKHQMDFHCLWQLTSCSIPGYGRNFMLPQASSSPAINTRRPTGCSVPNCVVWPSGRQVPVLFTREILCFLFWDHLGSEEGRAVGATGTRASRFQWVLFQQKLLESKADPWVFFFFFLPRKVCKCRYMTRGSGFHAGLNFMLFCRDGNAIPLILWRNR